MRSVCVTGTPIREKQLTIIGATVAIRTPDDVVAKGVLTSQINVFGVADVQGVHIAIFIGEGDGKGTRVITKRQTPLIAVIRSGTW